MSETRITLSLQEIYHVQGQLQAGGLVAPTVARDETEQALRTLRRLGEGVADYLDKALGCYRADEDEETRLKAVRLCVRSAERLTLEIRQRIARLP